MKTVSGQEEELSAKVKILDRFPQNFHFSFIFSHGHHVIINLDHLCVILWKKRIKKFDFPMWPRYKQLRVGGWLEQN
jgi:hypothetical protein